MSTPTYQVEKRRLGERLKALRLNAGPTQAALAKQLGWGQPKVSKIETGPQTPSTEDIEAWAAAVGAGPEIVDQLLDRLARVRVEYAHWSDAYATTGAGGVQEEILALEAQSTRIAELQPSMIPGLLQTAEYARDLLHLPSGPSALGATEADIDRMVAIRLQRQQVLYDPAKHVDVVILEGALHTRLCGVDALIGQLDRLAAVAGLPSLDLGIVQRESPVPVFPLSGFRLYDDLVILETISGEQQLSEPEDIALYERLFRLLQETARHGKEATAIARRALADIQLEDGDGATA